MSVTRIAILCVLVCVMAAGAVHGQGRGRRGGRDDRDEREGRGARIEVRETRGGGHRRAVARPPVVVRGYVAPPVVRVAPYGRRLGYRPVYRPGRGVGIYIGSPYRYSAYGYGWPYYAAPYMYGYAGGYPHTAYGGVYAVPPVGALYGGVRLDVTPRDAAVYVDGYYAGIVDDFDGFSQRVALEPGPHHFEIAAPGHQPLAFDVNVQMNQTIRYRGDLPRVVP